MDIEHVVVLMLENNSFDRMLGSLPGVDGIDPANPRSNPDPSGNAVSQAPTTMRVMLCDPADSTSNKFDPEHDLPDVLEQIDGPNLGFVRNFARNYSQCKPDAWAEVMKYYAQGSLPVLHVPLCTKKRFGQVGPGSELNQLPKKKIAPTKLKPLPWSTLMLMAFSWGMCSAFI